MRSQSEQGGDWREVTVDLPVHGSLVHVRLFLPATSESDVSKIVPTGKNDTLTSEW